MGEPAEEATWPENLRGVYSAYRRDSSPALVGLAASGSAFVPGRGTEQRPSVVFVGEAPGRTEDRQRRPFVGRSGEVLDQLLRESGMGDDTFFITNVVKYRPTDENGRNRTPTEPEIAASLPYLRREITLLNPLVIATLGRVPLQALMSSTYRVSSSHGRWWPHRFFGRPLICLYHPAVAVYQQSKYPGLLKDFLILKALVKLKGEKL